MVVNDVAVWIETPGRGTACIRLGIYVARLLSPPLLQASSTSSDVLFFLDCMLYDTDGGLVLVALGWRIAGAGEQRRSFVGEQGKLLSMLTGSSAACRATRSRGTHSSLRLANHSRPCAARDNCERPRMLSSAALTSPSSIVLRKRTPRLLLF